MKYVVALLLLCSCFTVSAQNTGKVTYEIKVNVHKYMTGERAKYKEYVPEWRTVKKDLFYNDSATLYKASPIEVDAVSGASRHRPPPEEIVHTNLNTKIVTEQREFMSKRFLISDTARTFEWKVLGESKMIDGMPCIKAEFEDTNAVYTAWFTPTIPVQSGPSGFGQLPGLIIEMTNADSSMIITTVELDQGDLEEDAIYIPKKGKKVTREEFVAIVREKMEEMKKNGGGGMFGH